MSGIFEQAMQRIEALENQTKAIIAHLQGGGQQAAQPVQQQAAQPVQQFGAATTLGTQQANPFGGLGGGGAVQQPQVTADMIQQLIMPLVQNEQAKQALSGQMQAMGITNLPDTRPDQMAELYQRFQQVAQQFGGGQAQQPAAQQPSII